MYCIYKKTTVCRTRGALPYAPSQQTLKDVSEADWHNVAHDVQAEQDLQGVEGREGGAHKPGAGDHVVGALEFKWRPRKVSEWQQVVTQVGTLLKGLCKHANLWLQVITSLGNAMI